MFLLFKSFTNDQEITVHLFPAGIGFKYRTQISLKVEGDCKKVNLDDFGQVVRNTTSQVLSIGTEQIQQVQAECGSIRVNFTLYDNNNTALRVTTENLGNFIASGDLEFMFEGLGYRVKEGYIENWGFLGVLSQATPSRTTATVFHPLETNYTPLIISVATGLAALVLLVCCTFFIHSWWLRKNKYTDVNSTPLKDIEKRKQKQELREIKRKEYGKSEFVSVDNFDWLDLNWGFGEAS